MVCADKQSEKARSAVTEQLSEQFTKMSAQLLEAIDAKVKECLVKQEAAAAARAFVEPFSGRVKPVLPGSGAAVPTNPGEKKAGNGKPDSAFSPLQASYAELASIDPSSTPVKGRASEARVQRTVENASVQKAVGNE